MNCKAFLPHLCQALRYFILSKWTVLLMLLQQYTCAPSAVKCLKCFAGLESLLLASLTAITNTVLEQQPPPKCSNNTL